MEIPIGYSSNFWKAGPFLVNGLKHTQIVGESGTGKSVLMTDMAIRDARAGRAIIFIDPHDEAADRFLGAVPRTRMDDVIVFDPLSLKPIHLNVLDAETREDKIKRADQFIDTISKVFGENSWGGQSDYIARNLLYAIIEVEDHPNPLYLFRALMNERYREQLFQKVQSENLKQFKKKFDQDWRDTQRELAAAPPTNKTDIAIANPVLRAVLCQRGGKGLDIFEAFEAGRIVVARIGKGRLGRSASRLFGTFILQECLFAGLQRERVKPADRMPVRVYVDEFTNFADSNDAADYILAELRKFNVSLVAAGQEAKKMPLANFISRIVFRVDPESAAILAPAIGLAELETLTTTPNFHFWAQTIRPEGYKSDPTLLRAFDPLKPQGTEYPAWRVVRHSEANNGTPRKEVEDAINNFLAAGSSVGYARFPGGENGKNSSGRNRKTRGTAGHEKARTSDGIARGAQGSAGTGYGD